MIGFEHDYDPACPCDDCQGVVWPAGPAMTAESAAEMRSMAESMAKRFAAKADEIFRANSRRQPRTTIADEAKRMTAPLDNPSPSRQDLLAQCRRALGALKSLDDKTAACDCLKHAHKRDVLNLLRLCLHDLRAIQRTIERRAAK